MNPSILTKKGRSTRHKFLPDSDLVMQQRPSPPQPAAPLGTGQEPGRQAILGVDRVERGRSRDSRQNTDGLPEADIPPSTARRPSPRPR